MSWPFAYSEVQFGSDLVAVAAHRRDGELIGSAHVGGNALNDKCRAPHGDLEQFSVRLGDGADAIDFERRLRDEAEAIAQRYVERRRQLADVDQAWHPLCRQIGGLDADGLAATGPQAADLAQGGSLPDFERGSDSVVGPRGSELQNARCGNQSSICHFLREAHRSLNASDDGGATNEGAASLLAT